MDRRAPIDECIAAGDYKKARRWLNELWEAESGLAAAGFILSRCEQMRSSLNPLPYRLAILRSFTVEPLAPLLRAAAWLRGIELTVEIGDFNAYAQEILDPESRLYRFQPDAVILAVQTRDVAPELWQGYAGTGGAATRVVQNFRDWLRAFRAHSAASLVVHTLEAPALAAQGLLDSQSAESQVAAIREINSALGELARESHGIYLLDYDALVARHGREQWHDERKWLTARMPVSSRHLMHLVEEWLRFLHPLTGKIAKALAVDLDNTLWGGIIGEDGLEGIRLGPEYPGAAYQAVQRAMLDLSRRGVLLAVCSKNNPEEALEAMARHPGMLLKPEHFAAMRINWGEKTHNLREIAAELNIGIDALAFLDDNPVERQHIREELPEVTVIELPEDPLLYARALAASPVFERLAISAEDRERNRYYAAQRQRVELEHCVASPEDFYRSLEQQAEVAPVSLATLARVAQLTQKTNQFNLTTRRYTEQQIAALAASAGWEVLGLRVRDRYSDNGLVGVAITCLSGDTCEIDTFLLSCRVIGRTVETALLAHLVERARRRGAVRVRGRFLPTRKNAPAKEFYGHHGFEKLAEDETGSLWELDLARQEPPRCPDWIRLAVEEGDPEWAKTISTA